MSCSYAAPVYANCFPTHGCGEFVLIVVLFILLIIVGAVCFC
ncbi:YjcZ family sporulation protein [Bacillus sp. USDA818B3_A]